MPTDPVSFADACARVAEREIVSESERVDLEQAVGRILADDVISPVDNPGMTNSAMDGFAVRAQDLPGRLWVVGESRAGEPWDGELIERRAVRISTGAELPRGADTVVPREVVRESGGWVDTDEVLPKGQFVRERGEDVEAGAVVVRSGQRIRAHEVTMLGGLGIARIGCRRSPRVAVLSSGDELVRPGAPRSIGQVYDASSSGLAAQVVSAGGIVTHTSHLADERESCELRFTQLFGMSGPQRPELIVTTGGASVGRHDHLPAAVRAAGAEEVFWGVEMRPGHPVFLAVNGDQVVLGLPGNPVSSMVCFHIFGRMLLGAGERAVRRAPMAEAYAATTERTELIRCSWGEDGLVPAANQGSHALAALGGADALAVVPEGLGGVQAGEMVRVIPLEELRGVVSAR